MEQSWCFRGDAERLKSLTRDETFVSEAISDECAAKVLLFSDMAMGWSGLRAVLVRIACMCPNDWAKQEKKVEKNTRSNRSNLGNHC